MRAATIATLLLAATASTATAGDTPDEEIARAHFQTGLSYYDSSRYAPAAREFMEAFRLSKKPALLFNIARAYEKLDDAGRATQYYRRYLAALPTSPEKRQIQNVLARFAPRVATLTIATTVKDAEVLVDDELVGHAPADLVLLTEGRHHVEVRHTGYIAAISDLALVGGKASTVHLEPTTGVVIANPPPAHEVITGNDTTLPLPSLDNPKEPIGEPSKDDKPPRPRWLWPVVGVGVAVVVAVAVAVVIALFAGTDYSANARNGCQPGTCVLFDGPLGMH
jgi:hypothetical protein